LNLDPDQAINIHIFKGRGAPKTPPFRPGGGGRDLPKPPKKPAY